MEGIPSDAPANFSSKVVQVVCCFLVSLLVVSVLFMLQRKIRDRRLYRSGGASTSGCRHLLCISSPEDGLFASSSLPRWTSSLISFFCVVLWIVPAFFGAAYFLGVILYAVQGWESDKHGFVFLLYGTGVLVDELCEQDFVSDAGRWICLLLAIWLFVAVNVVLGLSAELRIIQKLVSLMPERMVWFPVLAIVTVPLMLFVIIVFLAVLMSLVEGWDFKEAILWVGDAITGSTDYGLSHANATSDIGRFCMSLCMLVGVVLSGAIVAIVQAHPACTALLIWLEGADLQENVVEDEPYTTNYKTRAQMKVLRALLAEALARAEAAEAKLADEAATIEKPPASATAVQPSLTPATLNPPSLSQPLALRGKGYGNTAKVGPELSELARGVAYSTVDVEICTFLWDFMSN